MTTPIYLTRHARERMAEMHLTEADVLDVIFDAEQSWTGTFHSGVERTTYQRGAIAVIVQPEGRTGPFVVTVLHRTPDTYTRPGATS